MTEMTLLEPVELTDADLDLVTGRRTQLRASGSQTLP